MTEKSREYIIMADNTIVFVDNAKPYKTENGKEK